MSISQAVSQQVLIRSRLLGADLADAGSALASTIQAGQSLAHIVAHPSGLSTSSFTSRRPPQSALAVVSQPEPLRPAFQPVMSRL